MTSIGRPGPCTLGVNRHFGLKTRKKNKASNKPIVKKREMVKRLNNQIHKGG